VIYILLMSSRLPYSEYDYIRRQIYNRIQQTQSRPRVISSYGELSRGRRPAIGLGYRRMRVKPEFVREKHHYRPRYTSEGLFSLTSEEVRSGYQSNLSRVTVEPETSETIFTYHSTHPPDYETLKASYENIHPSSVAEGSLESQSGWGLRKYEAEHQPYISPGLEKLKKAVEEMKNDLKEMNEKMKSEFAEHSEEMWSSIEEMKEKTEEMEEATKELKEKLSKPKESSWDLSKALGSIWESIKENPLEKALEGIEESLSGYAEEAREKASEAKAKGDVLGTLGWASLDALAKITEGIVGGFTFIVRPKQWEETGKFIYGIATSPEYREEVWKYYSEHPPEILTAIGNIVGGVLAGELIAKGVEKVSPAKLERPSELSIIEEEGKPVSTFKYVLETEEKTIPSKYKPMIDLWREEAGDIKFKKLLGTSEERGIASAQKIALGKDVFETLMEKGVYKTVREPKIEVLEYGRPSEIISKYTALEEYVKPGKPTDILGEFRMKVRGSLGEITGKEVELKFSGLVEEGVVTYTPETPVFWVKTSKTPFYVKNLVTGLSGVPKPKITKSEKASVSSKPKSKASYESEWRDIFRSPLPKSKVSIESGLEDMIETPLSKPSKPTKKRYYLGGTFYFTPEKEYRFYTPRLTLPKITSRVVESPKPSPPSDLTGFKPVSRPAKPSKPSKKLSDLILPPKPVYRESSRHGFIPSFSLKVSGSLLGREKARPSYSVLQLIGSGGASQPRPRSKVKTPRIRRRGKKKVGKRGRRKYEELFNPFNLL